MRRIKFLLLVFIITLPIYSQKQKYNENINFKIDKLKDMSSIAVGHQSWIYPSRGNKFVVINVSFQNYGDEKDIVNLDDFILLNMSDRTKHKVELVRTTGIVNFPAKMELKIDKSKKKKRRLVYIFPKEGTAKFIMLNDKIIDL